MWVGGQSAWIDHQRPTDVCLSANRTTLLLPTASVVVAAVDNPLFVVNNSGVFSPSLARYYSTGSRVYPPGKGRVKVGEWGIEEEREGGVWEVIRHLVSPTRTDGRLVMFWRWSWHGIVMPSIVRLQEVKKTLSEKDVGQYSSIRGIILDLWCSFSRW